MSAFGTGIVGLFVERRAVAPAPLRRSASLPTVAVLCRQERTAAAVAAVGLALARAHGSPCVLVGAAGLGSAPRRAGVAVPAARRVAARLHAGGVATTASGRLVWIGDRRTPGAVDAVDAAAAASAELGHAATVAGVPAAIALPCARTASIDRVLTWHDALVAIREPDLSSAALDCVATSLNALGVPVVSLAPPSRHAAALAELGLHAPAAAVVAVARLALDRAGSPS